jgi:signal transduction histidine kinase
MTISAEPGFEDLDNVMNQISRQVTTVVEQLQQSQSEALRAEQLAAVGQLAAGLAHELRNPLTSIKILIQSALAPDAGSVVDREDLAVINQEVDRLHDLIESFLSFARPPQPERQRVSLLELVQPTIALVSRRAAVRNIRINLKHGRDALIVLADRSQMRQVFLNLLINAIEATPTDGEIVIQLDWPAVSDSLRPSSRESWVSVRVIDNGRGLPEQLGDRIFEPFVTTSQTGIGLGLSICRRIVEAHSGRIHAENNPAGGAVFTVLLPINSLLRQEALREDAPAYADAAGH